MALAEMASVTFIEYHDHLLITHALNTLIIVVTGDGTVQFLNGSDDDLAVSSKPIDKMTRVVGVVHGSRLKGFVLGLCLGVKVMAVNDKHHFVNTVNFAHELCRFE